MRHHTASVAVLGLTAGLMVTGCQEETTLTEMDQAGAPVEELVGEQMTLTNEVQAVLGQELVTIGAEGTMVFVDEVPDGLAPGDTVEATGTVEIGDPFSVDDLERLQQYTDNNTATYLVDRDREPYLAEATITKID
jgi:hypothetical protein